MYLRNPPKNFQLISVCFFVHLLRLNFYSGQTQPLSKWLTKALTLDRKLVYNHLQEIGKFLHIKGLFTIFSKFDTSHNHGIFQRFLSDVIP